MSGLTYGIMSAKNGIEAVVCERNSRVGKKISATGNGKCNLGNAKLSADCFNNSKIAKAVVENVPLEEYLAFLKSCGIYTFCDGADRLYPLSESAASVVDCLRHTFARFGGKTVTDCEVTELKKENGGFSVTIGGDLRRFDKVVLACGSASSAQQPNVTSFVEPQWLTKRFPSLVPVKISDMDKQLNGLRAKATVSLVKNSDVVAEERGEVQFKDYGLSGICVYNLSAQIARDCVCGNCGDYKFVLDLVPALSEAELTKILQERLAGEKEALFFGILHNKLAQCVVKRAESQTASGLARTAKGLQFPFEKLLDFSMSQVTSGGISEKYVDIATLALPNGIVAVGEVLDVDGLCGGYNLYFAAASAIHLFSKEQRQKVFGEQ